MPPVPSLFNPVVCKQQHHHQTDTPHMGAIASLSFAVLGGLKVKVKWHSSSSWLLLFAVEGRNS